MLASEAFLLDYYADPGVLANSAFWGNGWHNAQLLHNDSICWGVLGALVFMGVLLGIPYRGVCWPLCCWGR